jgi:pseudaminic acid synthase
VYVGLPGLLEATDLKTMADLEVNLNTVAGFSKRTVRYLFRLQPSHGSKNHRETLHLGSEPWRPDASFSFESQGFGEMAKAAIEVEKALGDVSYGLSERTEKGREFAMSCHFVRTSEDIVPRSGDVVLLRHSSISQ